MEPPPPTPPPPTPPAPPYPQTGWPASPAPSRRFSTGEVLSETFSVFFSSPVPLVITALIMVPFSILSILAVRAVGDPTVAKGVESLMSLIQNLAITPLATAAIVYAVFQRMRGRHVEAGDAIRVGLSKLGLVVGVAILQGLAIIAGLIFCIIPGIVVATMLAVAVPVAVEERPAAGSGAGAVLSRSSELTEGHRWSIFFVYACLLVLAMGVGIVIGIVFGLATGGNDLALEIATIPLVVVVNGLSATAATVMYYRLRSVKESLDVDQIASVFD
jgi:hypothetical protein